MALKINTHFKTFISKTNHQILMVSFLVACIFSIRYINCLPFSGYTREFNYETVATLLSYFIYAAEKWSFPIGEITSFTYPFLDANIGNVGGIPLFGVFFKILASFFPYFLNFDYFILVDIASSFFTAYFSQKILLKLGVHKSRILILGAFLIGTSLLLLNRSVWMQPFCIISCSIYTAWIYSSILVLEKKEFSFRNTLKYTLIFPVSVLLDGYSFFGVLLGSFVIIIIISYEYFFGGSLLTKINLKNIILYFIVGILLSYFALFIIGMYPMPNTAQTFTSYDFGIGGRYHGADFLSPIIPQGGSKFSGILNSLPSQIAGFPFTTDILSDGQYEGISYIGTPILIILTLSGFNWVRKSLTKNTLPSKNKDQLKLTTTWDKIFISVFAVFIYSLGYELHILGRAYPDFSLMPAAWISDRMPSLYNVRAMGRLAMLFSLFLMLEGIRLLSIWVDTYKNKKAIYLFGNNLVNMPSFIILFLAALHLYEIYPFLRPVASQPIHFIGGRFSEADVQSIQKLSMNKNLVMIAPSVSATDVDWEASAYGVVYYSKLKSNLHYIARTSPTHYQVLTSDLDLVGRGEWNALEDKYNKNILFVLPINYSDSIRGKVMSDYQEFKIKNISLWSKR